MTILQTLILSVVEGASEFLPISSTAHLILASKLMHIQQTQFTTLFEVVIQAGAILSITILYASYLRKHTKLIPHVLISFIPTAVIGLFMHGIIKTYFFQSNLLIAFTLGIGGILFIGFEYLISKNILKLTYDIDQLSPRHAIIIGLAQACAIVPGVSRAGAVLVGMMALGYKREDAAIYSFLLAVPTLLAAAGLDLLKTDPALLTGPNIMLLIVGSVGACVSALFVTRWFIQFLQKNTLIIFGGYRIVLAILTILFLL